MPSMQIVILLSALLVCAFATAACDDDDGADEEGMCFYQCDEGTMHASIGGLTESECNEEAENDEWCEELEELAFEPGCTECEDCAPDWYECW